MGHDGGDTQPPNHVRIERGTQMADEGPPPSLRLCEEGPDQEPRPTEATTETGTRGTAEIMVRLDVFEDDIEEDSDE